MKDDTTAGARRPAGPQGMRRPARSDLLIAAAAAAALVVAGLAGLPAALGAHPWWAAPAAIVGGIAGAVVFLALRLAGASPGAVLAVATPALLASAGAARYGKQAFAASFAENALAGRFWYFGWFALCGSVALLLAASAVRLLRR